MDDDTKDYSELKIDEVDNDEIDQTIEMDEETLLTVNEQIKEIKEDEFNDKIDELKEEQSKNKKLSTALIILIIILALLLIGIVVKLVFFKDNKPNNGNTNTISKITRPSDNLEYTILKQNQISLLCNKTSSGEKITNLKKGLIIECDLIVNTIESISELYFDLGSSSNLKLKNYKNDSDYELINDNNSFLLKATTPFNTLKDKIKINYEVIDITEKTGYAEIKNIIFKDNKENYYKMINSIIAFPPEYNDKIFIYKQTDNEEVYYIDSKVSLNDDALELIDTYKCSTEECEVKNNYENYFIIFDNNLLVYDTLQKTKQTIKIEESNFDYSKYDYEPITNKDNDLIGILFKKDYKENLNCEIVENYCIETSISGFDVSYYSLNKNMFTVALDYGFTGANIYTEYDKALLLFKNNKYGIFSYEDDSMVLELSKKYNSIEYNSDLNLVKLGMKDDKKNQYYYSYYNLDTNSFIIDINNIDVSQLNNSSLVYYIKDINKQGKTVYMLFNSKGEALKDLPYSMNLDIEIVDNKTIVIKNDDVYDIYDLNGNYIETSQYIQSGLNILNTTTSYFLALNNDNQLIVTNHIGKTLATLMPSNNLDEIYEIDTMSIVKCEEINNELVVIITNANITEDDKNAYKFTVNNSGNVKMEYTFYE